MHIRRKEKDTTPQASKNKPVQSHHSTIYQQSGTEVENFKGDCLQRPRLLCVSCKGIQKAKVFVTELNAVSYIMQISPIQSLQALKQSVELK